MSEKLDRLYRAIEDGIVDLDAHLKDRIDTLKSKRDLAQASLERTAVHANTRAIITPDRLAAFSEESSIPAIPKPGRRSCDL